MTKELRAELRENLERDKKETEQLITSIARAFMRRNDCLIDSVYVSTRVETDADGTPTVPIIETVMNLKL